MGTSIPPCPVADCRREALNCLESYIWSRSPRWGLTHRSVRPRHLRRHTMRRTPIARHPANAQVIDSDNASLPYSVPHAVSHIHELCLVSMHMLSIFVHHQTCIFKISILAYLHSRTSYMMRWQLAMAPYFCNHFFPAKVGTRP